MARPTPSSATKLCGDLRKAQWDIITHQFFPPLFFIILCTYIWTPRTRQTFAMIGNEVHWKIAELQFDPLIAINVASDTDRRFCITHLLWSMKTFVCSHLFQYCFCNFQVQNNKARHYSILIRTENFIVINFPLNGSVEMCGLLKRDTIGNGGECGELVLADTQRGGECMPTRSKVSNRSSLSLLFTLTQITLEAHTTAMMHFQS